MTEAKKPETISAEDALRWELVRTQLTLAQLHEMRISEDISRRYGLTPGDSVNLPTGVIVRQAAEPRKLEAVPSEPAQAEARVS